MLNAIDAQEWRGFSSGARPGRRPHHAVEAVTVGSAKRHRTGGRDAARRGWYAASDHAWLMQGVEHRLGAQRVVRHSGTGLKAGGLEEGHWRQQEGGTPPGGSASPLLAPRSLPAVLDRWAAQWRRRHARGEGMSVRDGDAGSVGVQHQDAAEPCVSALRERCHRFPRALPPDQTRRSAGGRWSSARRQRRGQGTPETCAVLGVTPRGGTTTHGKGTVRRRTIATRLRQTLQEVTETLRGRLHGPSEKLGAGRTRVVVGQSRDDGVPRNMGMLRVWRERVRRSWCRT